MKLRNKKTGEVAEIYLDNYTATNNIVSVCLKVKDDVSPDGYKYIASYTNLVELLEEWEDYTPQEPLIKDEKIRKAIRAWGYSPLTFKQHRRKGYCQFWYLDKYICFRDEFEGLKDRKLYTITELCGEEDNA